MQAVYSVYRLQALFAKALPSSLKNFTVAGEYYPLEDGAFQLLGQGIAVLFQQGAADFPSGSFVVVEVDAKNCAFESNQICVKEVQSIEILKERELYAGTGKSIRLKQWAEFQAQVESVLNQLGLLKVNTPSLVVNPGMEVELNSFKTNWTLGSRNESLFLPTSPELHLKRLLTSGLTDIYEIKTCFRNDELSEYHEAEFQMLEWYRAYADLQLIEQDLLTLIETIKPGIQVTRKSVSELFSEHLDFELTPQTCGDDLLELAKAHNLGVSDNESWNDLYHYLYVQKIEPHLRQYEALILYNYPPSQAALAKLTKEGWADRFELYIDGVEIANAFNELTNPEEQLERFKRQQAERKKLGKEVLPIDENFIRDLQKGMPPSGGIALGLDRLFMKVYGVKSIQEIRAFPMNDVLKGFEKS